MFLDKEVWMFLVLFPLVGIIYWLLRHDTRMAHKRLSELIERHNVLIVEIPKTYISREQLRDLLKPLSQNIDRLHAKLDKANGQH